MFKKISAVFFLCIYYCFARYLPDLPHIRVGEKCRRFCCRRLFKQCGENVNIEIKAYFGLGNTIEIGENSGIGKRAYITNIGGGGELIIGKDVMMAPDVVILTKSHCHERTDIPMRAQGTYSKKVIIEDDVWIGIRSVIMPGVKIGKGSIIGAGAVVTKDIPPYSVVGGWVGKVIMNKCIHISDKVTITTESLCQTYEIPLEKKEYLPNGVDIELFSPRPCDHIKEKYNLKDSFFVGHVGVLREWLDLEPLFIAIRELTSKINIKLLIVGGGAGYDKTVEMARDMGIRDHTIFTGNVPYSQVPEYISCMNVGVIPFRQDNVSNNSLPLKLFEYMACGVPVVSTPVSAIQEKFGQTVRFVSNADEYAQELMELYHDPNLCRDLGSEGRRIVKDEYQWTTIAKELEQILTNLGDNDENISA